jgi:hypothetical protein
MDKIDKLLEYVRRTNPEMTKERLIYELGACRYTAKSLISTAESVNFQKEKDLKS